MVESCDQLSFVTFTYDRGMTAVMARGLGCTVQAIVRKWLAKDATGFELMMVLVNSGECPVYARLFKQPCIGRGGDGDVLHAFLEPARPLRLEHGLQLLCML